MGTSDPKRTQIFISYSHQDAEWLKRLRVHLKPLEGKYGADVWDDTRIESGSKWRKEIKEVIQSARAALLLVSADFLASDFIQTDELPPLLLAAEQGGATILPVIVSPCRYAQEETLSQFQSVNPPSRPLTGMTRHEQEEIFVKVAGDLEKVLLAPNRSVPTATAQAPSAGPAKAATETIFDLPKPPEPPSIFAFSTRVLRAKDDPPRATEEASSRTSRYSTNKAVADLQKRAEQGSDDAQFALAMRLLQGAGIPKDLDQGLEWLRSAEAQGHKDAKYELGRRLLHGIGIQRNVEEGKRLLNNAAEHGD